MALELTERSAPQPRAGSAAVTSRVYSGGVLVAADFPIDDLAVHLRESERVIWVDLYRPTEEELVEVCRELGLDPLAVEDALSRHERPKVDRYPSYAFVNAYTATLDTDADQLLISELSAFVGARILVTVRHDGGLDLDAVTDRWEAAPELLRHGVGALLWGLLDVVVDGHFAVVQRLDEEVEAIEDLLFDERVQQEAQRRTFALRKSLVQVRRVALPMREVVNALMRRDLGAVDADLLPYYQDVYDHVLRVAEWTEGLRDMVSTIFETTITLQDHRLNAVMRKLTAWAAIIAVPTAVTGYFGQNVPFPGFASTSGFVASLVLIVGIAGFLYLVLKKHGWL